MRRLYFAYGMNMDLAAMARRCPSARRVAAARLPDHRFALNRRGVSTVLQAPADCVHGILWTLTADCEAALDRIEGIAQGHYLRAERRVLSHDGEFGALVYVATDETAGPPRQPYFDIVRAAARQHGFPPDYLSRLDALR